MRHAPALSLQGGDFTNDAERPLSDEGRRLMGAAAEGLKREGVSPERILVSPFLRARETAGIVAETLGIRERVQIFDEMASGTNWIKVSESLHAYSHLSSLLLVGHQPDLSEMAAGILGEGPPISFSPGSVACFDVMAIPPVRRGVLLWRTSAEELAGPPA